MCWLQLVSHVTASTFHAVAGQRSCFLADAPATSSLVCHRDQLLQDNGLARRSRGASCMPCRLARITQPGPAIFNQSDENAVPSEPADARIRFSVARSLTFQSTWSWRRAETATMYLVHSMLFTVEPSLSYFHPALREGPEYF